MSKNDKNNLIVESLINYNLKLYSALQGDQYLALQLQITVFGK